MAVERVDVYLRELLSSGLLLLHTELGVDLGLNAELLPPGLLTCVAAALGLLVALLLWVSVCRCFSNKPVQKVTAETVKTSKPKPEEVKKRNRKRGEKKVQKNGLAVDLEAVLKPAEAQNQSESPDPAGGKGDKEKKSKKKAKAPVKEKTSLSASERREPEEGTWETKVSQREKRQQRKKDKGAGDESGSPGGTELSSNAANPENPVAVEEPKIISTPSVTSTNTTTRTNTKTKTSNISTTSNTKTTNIKTSTKNTKTTSTTPAPKAQKNSPRTQQAVVPVEHEHPVAEVTRAEVTRAVIPPVSHAWDVLAVNGSGSWDLGVSVPPHSQTWNSVKSEPSVWPQDMEGSWMIVDGSHIPVSLHGITAGVEAQVVPDRSWVCPAPVDDEWSGPNSGCVDPASDYCAPCEEWGNYEPAGGVVSPDEPQDSDLEKDKDEPAAAPGSNKAKKKKKKKKKAEEAGSAAQVEMEVGVVKDQNTAGNMLLKNAKEQEIMAAPQAPLKSAELEAPPTQKKADESWESQKQVKKKKARRET